MESRNIVLKKQYTLSVPGGGGTPYNGLYREAPPERGVFFRIQVHERIGILLDDSEAMRARGIIVLVKSKLVGQKFRDKTTLASKTRSAGDSADIVM